VFPSKREVEAGLSTLLDRGVALYFFFTDGLEEYNYEAQHADAFRSIDLGRHARIRYVPGSTHLVTDLAHQQLLLDDLAAWLPRLALRSPVAA
jgi:hypothetical protein